MILSLSLPSHSVLLSSSFCSAWYPLNLYFAYELYPGERLALRQDYISLGALPVQSLGLLPLEEKVMVAKKLMIAKKFESVLKIRA